MAFEQGHALVIGVGSYEHIPYANIPISAADALAVAEVLADPKLCGYPPTQVTILRDATARREQVLAALDALATNAPPEGTVLLYYCGHGDYAVDGDYYFTTHDSKVDPGGTRLATGGGVSELELIAKLRSVRARRVLLILNACHSGEVSPSLETPVGAGGAGTAAFAPGGLQMPLASATALLSSGEGRIIITACRSDQRSWIGGGPLTVFTQALLDGIKGKGYVANNGGYVGAFGLYEHLFVTVRAAAAAIGNVQEPELTVLKGVGPFPVSLYRGATAAAGFDASESLSPATPPREVDPTLSRSHFDRFAVRIEKLTGGFVQPGWKVQGSVKQAGRDFYESGAPAPEPPSDDSR